MRQRLRGQCAVAALYDLPALGSHLLKLNQRQIRSRSRELRVHQPAPVWRHRKPGSISGVLRSGEHINRFFPDIVVEPDGPRLPCAVPIDVVETRRRTDSDPRPEDGNRQRAFLQGLRLYRHRESAKKRPHVGV